jgi:Xaa-Pro aminopeptidase
MVTMTKVFYYVGFEKVTPAVKEYLAEHKISVRPYSMLGNDMAALKERVIWADLNKLSAALYSRLDASNTVISEPSPILKFRAVKNETEIRNTVNAHVKDGVAMVKFLCWVKQAVSKEDLTEVSAQEYLYALRKEGKDYIEPSFPTICAYKEIGAGLSPHEIAVLVDKIVKCRLVVVILDLQQDFLIRKIREFAVGIFQ